MTKGVYTAWIRIDETLPWIELKGEYPTKSEAKRAAEETLEKAKIKCVTSPEKSKPVKAVASLRAIR
jgi:hypothetical protein